MKRAAALSAVAVAAAAVAFAPPSAAAGITTENLLSALTPADMAGALAGPGVTVSNVTYTGAPVAGGTFAGGASAIGFDTGVVLSSGDIANVVGPNSSSSAGTSNGAPGNSDLDAIVGASTFDAAVLEFDVTPTKSPLTFSYVFGSEEYNEFVNQGVNDVFAFFVNGINCAKVPGTDDFVSIDTVNQGVNSGFYVNNDFQDGSAPRDTQLDGLTVVLTCTVPVTPAAPNHIKLAIADTGDSIYDSAVFLQADSFTTEPPPTAHATTTTYGGGTSVQYSDPLAVSGTLVDTTADPDAPVPGKSLSFGLGSQSTSGTTDAAGQATSSITVDQAPGPYPMATSFAGDTGFLASADSDAVTVAKEDCTLSYTGSTSVGAGSSATMSATLGEPDTSLGDRSGKQVAFAVTDGSSTTTVLSATTNSAGAASVTQALPPGAYAVVASFGGDDYYLACASGEALLVVASSDAKVTGGGFVVDGGRTSFGFTASAGAQLRGQLQVRAPGKHRFHGASVTSMTAGAGSATWSGAGRWDGTSGYSFVAAVQDNRKGGSKKGTVPDWISLTVRDGSGSVVWSTSGYLKGGNITVH